MTSSVENPEIFHPALPIRIPFILFHLSLAQAFRHWPTPNSPKLALSA